MKLLIITQKIDRNDGVLSFFHRWVEEFSKYCEKITVVCLAEGEHDLPPNVKVLSLGKEGGENRIKYLYRFYKYIVAERRNYDNVFVHMNQIYVILGGLFWKLWHKKIGFWYAHGHVPPALRIAENISDIIFTSTALGFRMKSNKIKIVGQGIDIDLFRPSLSAKTDDGILKIITVGRISPSKDYDTMIGACSLLNEQKLLFKLNVIGNPIKDAEKIYFEKIKGLVTDSKLSDKVFFLGEMGNNDVAEYLRKADIFVNCGLTGSLDKAILEAMACGVPVLSCNESYSALMADDNTGMIFEPRNSSALAGKIIRFSQIAGLERQRIGIDAAKLIRTNFSIGGLIQKIVNEYK